MTDLERCLKLVAKLTDDERRQVRDVIEAKGRGHEWSGGLINCCVNCEAFPGEPKESNPCRPTGKMEPCCECGEDYPRSDLLRDGDIYCPKCRVLPSLIGRPDARQY